MGVPKSQCLLDEGKGCKIWVSEEPGVMEGGWQGPGLKMLPLPSAELSFPRDKNGREGVSSSEMDGPEPELRYTGFTPLRL